MAILDSKGRLFGKISLLDIGAALVILMVVVGVFFYPGAGDSVAQVGANTKDIEVDVMTRGLTVLNPEAFLDDIRSEGSTNIIIRNQPYGRVTVKEVETLPRSTAVPQPDGSVAASPDPRPELDFTVDFVVTVTGKGQLTDDGPVLGNSKVKIGTPIELEGQLYTFRGSTVAVRIIE